jgi:hypothetical protein
MPEAFTINGVSLDTYAYMLTDISGIMSTAPRRGSNVTVPGRHGAIRTPKRYDPAELVLPMWVVGALPDGSVPTDSTAAKEFFKRRDELLLILNSGTLLLEYTRPDGTSRSAYAELVETLEFARIGAGPEAKVSAALSLFEGFWFDTLAVSQEVTGATGTIQALTAFEGATAPMTDLTLTFGPANNPQINVGDGYVKYNGVISSGRQLVINAGNWTVNSGTGAAWSPDLRQVEFSPGPRWFELDPTVSPFEVEFVHTGGSSATCIINGRRRYLSP